MPAGARATTLTLRSGSRVDQMGLTLSNGTTLTHGGTGGTASSLTLGSEYVTSAQLCQGVKDGNTRIFLAELHHQPRQQPGGWYDDLGLCDPHGAVGLDIAGFHGRTGDEVDKLGFIYTQRCEDTTCSRGPWCAHTRGHGLTCSTPPRGSTRSEARLAYEESHSVAFSARAALVAPVSFQPS